MSVIDGADRKSRIRLQDFVRRKSDLERKPTPPYYLRDSDKLYVAATVDPDLVRPWLPAGVTLAPSNTAILSVYTIEDGPFGPYSGAVLGVAVTGHDSIDGMEGVFWIGGYVSENGAYLQRDYESAHEPGQGRIWREGDVVFGEAARTDGTGAVRFRVRLNGASEALYDGAYNYLGNDGQGGARIFSLIGYARDALYGQLEAFEISDDAAPAIRALKPVSLSWGIHLWHINMIFGAPHRLAHADQLIAADATKGALLAVFDHYNNPAVVVERNGIAQFVNAAGAMTDLQLTVGERLELGGKEDQRRLMAAVETVVSGEKIAESFALSPVSKLPRNLVQVTALDPRLAGSDSALVVLMSPDAPPRHDPAPLLRLFGLTAAEARLAAEVGSGVSPREAAGRLDIAESTARTTIKVVYEKLGIGRQSELARLVTRLETL